VKCPHCDVGIYDGLQKAQACALTDGQIWYAFHQLCPECKKAIIFLEATRHVPPNQWAPVAQRFLAYPPRVSVRPVPAEVPDPFRQDFDEAVAVLSFSPKASAALSRRNLQAILRDKAGAKKKDLFDQIEEVIASGKLPSHIVDSLHAVRVIGNFAAHPTKNTSTGEIVDVEVGEAEWNLDVLESLFDFYFVQPALTAKRKVEINKKLKDAGKPELV
jgi:hypothetical protein